MRGEYLTGRVPQALLVAGEVEQGDVLTLRAPKSVDELRVVLRGRVREI